MTFRMSITQLEELIADTKEKVGTDRIMVELQVDGVLSPLVHHRVDTYVDTDMTSYVLVLTDGGKR